ncbi:MAG: AI-2E family transporter [Clostridia bacterium]|nr:AI-2E family transporter [Clostridia bacterium]
MNITWKNCFKIAVTVFLIFLCIFYWDGISSVLSRTLGSLIPLFAGLAIAYVINMLMSFFERHYFPKKDRNTFLCKTRRSVCMIGAIATLLIIVGAVVYLIVPELILCVKFLIAEIPPMIVQLLRSQWVREILPADIITQLSSIDWMSHVTTIINTVGAGIGGAVNVLISALSSVISVVITVFLSIIFSVYLLYSKERFISQISRLAKSYLPRRISGGLTKVFHVLNDSFHKFIVGQCAEAVILGVLCGVGMLIFRFPYPGMVGTLVGFTALIPVAGAYIGAIVGAVMILTESPIKALLFVVFILVLQQLEGNLIYPRVVGGSLGLPAIWVLASATLGGALMGVLGMIIGVPLAATVYRLVKDDLHRRENASDRPCTDDC